MSSSLESIATICQNSFHLINKSSSKNLETICLVILIFVPCYTFGCVLLFLYYKNSYVWLYRRNITMLLVFACGVLLSLYPNAWRVYSGAKSFRCVDLFIFEYFEAALLLLPFFTRLTNLLLRVSFNRALIEHNFKYVGDGSFFQNTARGKNGFISNSSEAVSLSLSSFESLMYTVFCWSFNTEIPDKLRFKYFWSSQRVANILFSTIIFFVLVLTLSNTSIYTDCTGCTADESIIVSLPLFGILFVLGGFVLFSNRDIPDGIGVKHEMKLIGVSLLIFEIIALPLYLTHKDFEEDGRFAWSLLFYTQVLIVLTISFPYQVYLASKPNNAGYIDDGVTVEDLLNHREGSKAFALYLATALCAENVFFYKAVEKWKADHSMGETSSMAKEAKSLFDKYISDNGSMIINLCHKVRDTLITRFQEEDYDMTMFDCAKAAVVNNMKNDMLFRFKNSIYYQAYLGNISALDLEELL